MNKRKIHVYLRQMSRSMVGVLLVVLLSAPVLAQQAATVEMTLSSKDLPPSVANWTYYYAGNTACGLPAPHFLSEASVLSCYRTIIENAQNGCPMPLIADGDWYNDGVLKWGVSWVQERKYHYFHNDYQTSDGHSPSPHCDVQSIPINFRIRSVRDVACDQLGYSDGIVTGTACKNNTTKKIQVTPVVCQKDGAGDTFVGDPCDASSGDQVETAVDYEGPAIGFRRTYHSLVQVGTSGLGIGWTHNYSTRLVIVANVPKLVSEANGTTLPLSLVSAGTYQSTTGSDDQVKANPDVSGEWIVYRASGQREFFSSAGQLLQRQNANGLVTVLTYATSDGLLERITGPFGHSLVLGYDNLRLYIATITDPTGGITQYQYDAADNLSKVTYPDSKYVQYLHENAGLPHALTGIVDENLSQLSTIAYDGAGRVMASQLAGGVSAVTLNYSVANQTTVTYADASQEVFTFTAHPNPWSWTVPGEAPVVSHDSMESAIVAARGLCTDCWNLSLAKFSGYTPLSGGGADFRKMLSSSLTGQTIVHSSDATRRLDSVTDANGNRTKYGYGASYPYHRTTVTEADQDTSGNYKRPTTTTYLENTSALPATVIAPSVTGGGNTKSVATTYNGNRQVTSTSVSGYDPGQPGTLQERITSFPTYDGYAKLPTLILGPRVNVADDIALSYWAESTPGVACATVDGGACGQLKTMTNALGQLTAFDAYYPDGRLQQMTDANALVTTYTYDLRGRLNTVTETPTAGTARVTDYDYDAAGQLQKVTQPNGQILNYVWTTAHLLDYVTDNAGNKVDVSHDSRGNQTGTALLLPNGGTARSESLTYDARNYLDTRRQGARPAADLTFDATGRLEGETDSGGRFTDYNYDPLNRLKQVIDPQNGASAPANYVYNVRDDLTSVQTPNGATTTYVYDDLGNLRKEVSPDRGTTLYGYDEAGNMSCRADGRSTAGATRCEDVTNRGVYQYDALNRVTSIDYIETAGSADVTYVYDTRDGTTQAGRLRQVIEIKSPLTVTRKMDYDAWGNVTWSEQTVANGATSKTYATSYQYDGNSQLKKITYPSGRVVDYTRHPNGQIKDVKVTFNAVTTTVVALANYEPFVGPPQSIGYGNGMTQLLLSATDSAPAVYFLFDATTSLSFEDQTYAVANTGDITQVRDNLNGSNTRNYQYDNLDRLTWDSKASATNPTYTYDANGNRLTRAAGTYAAQSFTYSASSNRDVGTAYDGMGNALNDSATYSAAGRLNSVVESGNTLSLNYNGLGELARTALTQVDACSGAITTLATDDFVFTPDGRALYLRTTNTVATGTDYVWLDNLPVAQFQDNYDTQGALIGTEVTYLHADYLGTPRLGTNASREVTWRYRSDAFGNPELSGTAVVRLRFPGQVSLGTSGLNYNYYRDYQPDLGRYLESDPIGLKGGLNTYGYVEQNPLRYVDPTGEFLNLPGIAIGAGAETFLQLARNDWRWECLDVTEIAVAGAFGAFAPGLAPALRNVKAIRVLAEQLQRARAPSRIAKIAGRLGRHQSSALDTVSTVAGYQAVKWIGEQFWSEVERITPNTSEPDNCGETEPCK